MTDNKRLSTSSPAAGTSNRQSHYHPPPSPHASFSSSSSPHPHPTVLVPHAHPVVQKEPSITSSSQLYSSALAPPPSANYATMSASTMGGFAELMTVDEADMDLPPPTTATTEELGYLNQVSELVVKRGLSVKDIQQLKSQQSAAGGGGSGTSSKSAEPSMYSIEEKGTGEKLYRVYEDTTGCHPLGCGSNRSFKLRLMDNLDRELIQVERPYIGCDHCCGLTSCFDIVNVWVRNYKSKQLEWRRFGQIRQFWCPLLPYFSVRNSVGAPELSIRGPLFTSSCFMPVVFSIKKGSEVVGSITKEKGLPCREVASGTDVFSLKFPPGIDEKLKVTLIGALLLVHFKYYENSCRCS